MDDLNENRKRKCQLWKAAMMCLSAYRHGEIGFSEIPLTVIHSSMQNQDAGMIFDFPINQKRTPEQSMYNRASQAHKISSLRLDGIRSNSSLTKESASTLRFNQSLFAESPWLPSVKRYMKQIMRESRDRSLTSFNCSHAHLPPYENEYDIQDSSPVSQKSVRFLTIT